MPSLAALPTSGFDQKLAKEAAKCTLTVFSMLCGKWGNHMDGIVTLYSTSYKPECDKDTLVKVGTTTWTEAL